MSLSGPAFGSILVCVDGSDRSARAVAVAIEEAVRHGAGLTVLHIIEVPVSPYYPDRQAEVDTGGLEQAARDRGERMVSEAARAAEARGVRTGREVVRHTGHSTAEGIVEYAKAHGADLIVVGSSGMGGIKGLLLGSVANGVVGSAKCSVLVAR